MARSAREQGFDPHEFGARRSDPSLAGFDPLPAFPRRLRPLTLLTGFAALVAVAVAVHGGARARAVALPASCTTPAYAVSALQAPQAGAVRWSAVGPASSSVVFALDSTAPPTTAAAGLLTGPVVLAGCRASGQFPVRGAPGAHLLAAFLLGRDGRSTMLRRQPFTITGS